MLAALHIAHNPPYEPASRVGERPGLAGRVWVYAAAVGILLTAGSVVGAPSALAQVPLPEMGAVRNPLGPELYFSAGGPSLTLTVNSATAGSDPDDVTDATTELTWDADFGQTAKITVSTLCPGQSFSLFVELDVNSWASGTQGTEQPEITLSDGMLDTDIFRDIPPTIPERRGSGTLTYRASATAAQGNGAEVGDDFHTVIFTALAQ